MAVIGAGFAGVSTAAALARSGVDRGVILEREPLPGAHASGRNAAIARQIESCPELTRLAVEGVSLLRQKEVDGRPIFTHTGALYLLHDESSWIPGPVDSLRDEHVPVELLSAGYARRRLPFLAGFNFDVAVFCPTDGVVDIHALLMGLLAEAKSGGFELLTGCGVESVILEGEAVRGVQTSRGEIRAEIVVDASGAWAGRLGRDSRPLPLKALRRHLFVSGPTERVPPVAPVIWDLDAGYYFRPDGPGLLLCPCDETEHPPCEPAVDPQAQDLLVDKLLRHAPDLADLELRRCWACLRTFAPDRLPVIGWDAEISGLFHVSGLGGFGVSTCLATGDLAAKQIRGTKVDWIDAGGFGLKRSSLRCESQQDGVKTGWRWHE